MLLKSSGVVSYRSLFDLSRGSGLGLDPNSTPTDNSLAPLAVLVLVIYTPVLTCGLIQTSPEQSTVSV